MGLEDDAGLGWGCGVKWWGLRQTFRELVSETYGLSGESSGFVWSSGGFLESAVAHCIWLAGRGGERGAEVLPLGWNV